MVNYTALASIAKLSASVDISSSSGGVVADSKLTLLAADNKLTRVSLQKALASVLQDKSLLDTQIEAKVALRKALDRVVVLMGTQQGSGEAILADIHKLLGLSLDLLRHSFPSHSQAQALNEWNQHVADVWLCTLQCQSALWEVLGKGLTRSDSSSSALTLESLTDDDEQAIRGTVFHQLLCTFVAPDLPEEAVNVSPDVEKILPILCSQHASAAIRLSLNLNLP